MSARPVPTLRRLARADLDEMAAVLGRAFAHNPGFSAILAHLGPAERERAVPRLNRGLAKATLRQGEATGAFVDGALAGVSLVLPPGGYPLRLGAFVDIGLAALHPLTLRGIPQLLRMDAWSGAHHPKEPHHYLFVLGVEPALQGRGVGSALLRQLTARADGEGLPCWLETDKEDNLVVYRRHGFEVVHDEEVRLGKPVRMWTMRREPRSRATIGA